MPSAPASASSGEPYYVCDGVRRAVAARECQVAALPARLKEPGMTDRRVVVAVDRLYSPKRSVSAADPRYARVLAGMASPLGRAKIPPLEIEPLGAPGQTRAIPIGRVVLTS